MKFNCGIKNLPKMSRLQVDLNKTKAQVEPGCPSEDYKEKPWAVLVVSFRGDTCPWPLSLL